MFLGDGFQSSRFELKYIISESAARGIRDFALCYLEPDPHTDPTHGNEYPVHSLYLDSPGLELCKATMHGLKNRFKLRIRFYDDSPDSPAFLEIKRRLNDVIRKQRVAVRKSCIARVLRGHWPTMADLIDQRPKSHAALQQFCDLRTQIGADGQVIVSYTREAYVSHNSNNVRLTFDRRLHGVRYRQACSLDRSGERVYPRVAGVILELKFTDRFPVWMRHMARTFSLERCSMAKYVSCIEALNVPALQLQ